jgi:hypothetical protein
MLAETWSDLRVPHLTRNFVRGASRSLCLIEQCECPADTDKMRLSAARCAESMPKF